jgi:hypothetical protein
MTLRLKCNCGRILRVQDSAAGKAVRCPACQEKVHVPANMSDRIEVVDEVAQDVRGQRAADDDADDSPVERRPVTKKPRRSVSSGMRMARIGVILLLAEIVLQILGFGLVILVLGAAVAAQSPGTALMALITLIGVVVIPPLLGITGIGLCLAVPDSGVRTPLIGAILCRVVGIGLGLLTKLDVVTGIAAAVADGVNTMVTVCGFAMLMAGLRRLAELARSSSVAREAEGLMAFGIGFYIGAFIVGVLGAFSPCLAALGGLVLLVVGIMFLIRYIRVLNYVREAIELRI